MSNKDESAKFTYFILFRLFLSLSILIVGWGVLKINRFEFFFLVGLLILLNIPWIIIIKKEITFISPTLHANLQLYTDLLIEIGIIHYSGGVTSPFIYLPLISILSSAFLVTPRQVVIYSISAAVLYVGIASLEFFKWLPTHLLTSHIEINPVAHFYYMTFLRVIVFVFIGYLASVLTTRIRKQTEEIAKYKHLEEDILFQIKSGLITINIDDSIIYSNKAATEILGYSNDELLGRDWHFIFFGSRDNINSEIVRQAKSLRGVELKIEAKSGLSKIIGFNLSELKNEFGDIFGKTMVFRDITHIKNMEEKLKIKNKMVAIGELAAIMAHELKNPLTSICGCIEVLRESGTFTTNREKELIHVIFKESDRLSRTLGEFLAFTGETFIKKERREVLQILNEVITLIRNSRDFNSSIVIDKKYEIKDFYFAFLDEKQIKQVFFNLVINAVQAMPDGGILSLEVIPYEKDNLKYCKIIIRDTGKGINKDIQDKIFNPFYTSKEKGIGLGLTVVQKIIEKHGWTLELKSTPNKGCEATIDLPVTQ